jgi:hypothetical protein
MRRWMLVGLAAVLLVAGSSAGASAANQWPATPVAGAATRASKAVWSVQANGVVAVDRSAFYGDAHRQQLAQPITGMAVTPTGKGYWLVASDGGVFAYGDARFFGSMAGRHLNAPIVGIASSKYGGGYWLVAADGGIFTFGTAPFLGSLGGLHLVQPIIGISALRSGAGYRLVARDGGVFTFGEAVFWGSLGGRGITDVVGIAQTPTGNGYWILRKFGGTAPTSQSCMQLPCPGPSVANFGDARNLPGPSFASDADVLGTGRGYDTDFTRDPVVAIVGNPVRQGYAILRANRSQFGWAGAMVGT